MPITPVLRGLRQGDHEFKANLRYIVNPCLKITTKIHQILHPSRVHKANPPVPLLVLRGSALVTQQLGGCPLAVEMSHLEAEPTVSVWVEGQGRLGFAHGHSLCPSLRQIL